jgi:hypothetical protein
VSEIQVTFWREIPSMVAARQGEEVAKVQLPQRFQEAIDEAGKLGATLLFFEGAKYVKNKLAPKVSEVKVVPKGEVPQDVKQTLQIEAPKKETFSHASQRSRGFTTRWR